MCDLCAKHGDGGKWFLNASNYSEDLLSDLRRRREALAFLEGNRNMVGRTDPMDTLRLVPKPLRHLVNRGIVGHMKWRHHGQVVTLDEIRAILRLVTGVVRIPCVCRRITIGEEQRHCFGLALRPGSSAVTALVDEGYWKGPDGSGLGVEHLTPEEALPVFKAFNRQGLIHSVWTLGTPFMASICNCSPTECRALKARFEHDLRVLHPGEGVVALEPTVCTGCGFCTGRCSFGALIPIPEKGRMRITVDRVKCIGCGLCVETCGNGALSLAAR